MTSGKADGIAKRLRSVVDDINKELETGDFSAVKARAVAKKLKKIADKITETNADSRLKLGSKKGAQLLMHTEAVALEKQLLAVIGGFERIADRGKRVKRGRI